MSFYEWNFPGSPFWSDRWEEWICSIAERAAELGVRFGQCHGHTYSFLWLLRTCAITERSPDENSL